MDGEAVTFDPSQILVKLGSKVVPQKAEDGTTDNYTISYRNNTEVGTASVVIQGIETGKYVGSCTKTLPSREHLSQRKQLKSADCRQNFHIQEKPCIKILY